MNQTFTDATPEEVSQAMDQSWQAFAQFRKKDLKERAGFLRSIANELQKDEKDMIRSAVRETHLEEARLKIELKRTIFQLTSYAEACEEGTWLDIRIDTADPHRTPPKPDLRKMLVPIGPVVVFGASNFPFAYSTAGGDTASALAAGGTVVIKAHPAHAHTSQLVADAIHRAAKQNDISEGVFIHLHGASFDVGKALVQHPYTKAVGFTGSFEGGKALFDLANQRTVPIPVFAEMGSVNPVFLLPQKLSQDTESISTMYAASITQSAGQFCTNPGILVAIQSDALNYFKTTLGRKLAQVPPAKMLHKGITKSFHQKRNSALSEEGVHLIAQTEIRASEEESIPTLAEVTAKEFLRNHALHKEVFGPFSLLVVCANPDEMMQVALALEGQLTATVIGTEQEVASNAELVAALQTICGRLILNGVSTGVEVALAMHHGGPFPATTDSRFTSVGADAIKRFARPVCFQNWNNSLLPVELRDENTLELWRTVNNELTKDKLM